MLVPLEVAGKHEDELNNNKELNFLVVYSPLCWRMRYAFIAGL